MVDDELTTEEQSEIDSNSESSSVDSVTSDGDSASSGNDSAVAEASPSPEPMVTGDAQGDNRLDVDGQDRIVGEDDEDQGSEGQNDDDVELNDLGFSADEMIDDDEDLYEEEDEDASPIEELVDESVVEVTEEDLEMDWYILKVQVNREKSICENLKRRVRLAGLDRYFGDVLVPTEDVREYNKSGKPRTVKRKLYPGYIVVHMSINDDSWFLVRETSGIGDFTGSAGKPAPLSKEEIDRIIATTKPEEDEEGEEKIKIGIKFKVGDQVRVKEGYFQNYEGEVSTIDERNGRITVMINIFGRPNPVELDHWQVEDV